MGWSIWYDSYHKRDVGYGVPATCDNPGCNKKIDRGLAYICCGQQISGGEEGCGLFFCYDHATPGEHKCARCATGKPRFKAKADRSIWIRHKLSHGSWREWREENPMEVARMRGLIRDRKRTGNASNAPDDRTPTAPPVKPNDRTVGVPVHHLVGQVLPEEK
jgi:hypothetical protein